MIRLIFVLAIFALAAFSLAACGDDDANGPRTLATYHESCPACGMEWRVDVLERDGLPASARVEVRNTGERGTLTLVFNQVGGAFLTTEQAAIWSQVYATARAARRVPQQFSALGSAVTQWRPAEGTSLPATLQPGASWSGSFEVAQGSPPPDAAALILTFGPVSYERVEPGQPASEYWITWDPTRPFISLHGEVRVTPQP